MKIVGFPSDRTACSWQRLYMPLYWVRKQGLAEVQFCYISNEDLCRGADVIVYQRHYEANPLKWWRTMLSWPDRPALIYEIDDDVWAIRKSNPFNTFYSPAVLQGMAEMIHTADLVTMPCAGLAKAIKELNPNVWVLPSGIDPEAFEVVRNEPRLDAKEVRIGYAASQTHDEDLEVCLNAIRRVMIKRKHVRLVLQGSASQALRRYMRESGLENRCEFHDWLPFERLYEALPKLAVDFWIAPLAENRFNRGKSHIKIVEAWLLKCPVIASPVGIYADVVEPGVTGYLPRTQSEWETSLFDLIDHPEDRREMGRIGHDIAKTLFSYDKLAWRWVAAAESVLRSRTEAQELLPVDDAPKPETQEADDPAGRSGAEGGARRPPTRHGAISSGDVSNSAAKERP